MNIINTMFTAKLNSIFLIIYSKINYYNSNLNI